MRQEGPDPEGFCVPQCVWFKCGRDALQLRGNVLWCQWLEQPCLGPSCSYSVCSRNKMLPQNRCGLVVRRITRDLTQPEDYVVDVKLKGRLANMLDDDVI